MKYISKPWIIGLVSVVTISSAVAAYVWYESLRPPILEVYVIPLKTGQALFIRTPHDKRILVDGGPTPEIIRHISGILPFYSRRIDTIIITKPDAVHVTGLVDVVDRYNVGEVLVPNITLLGLGLATSSDQIYSVLTDSIATHKIPLKEIVADKSSLPYKIDEIIFSFLFPVSSEFFKYSKASGPELVFNISNGSKSILNIGSVTAKIQKYIASSTDVLGTDTSSGISRANIIITSKSPSTTNLADKFLDKFKPDTLIYSKALKKSEIKEGENMGDEKRDVGDANSRNISNTYNIRETGIIKIAVDGQMVNIEKNSE